LSKVDAAANSTNTNAKSAYERQFLSKTLISSLYKPPAYTEKRGEKKKEKRKKREELLVQKSLNTTTPFYRTKSKYTSFSCLLPQRNL